MNDLIGSLKVGCDVIVLEGQFEGLCGSILDVVKLGHRTQYMVSLENGEFALYYRQQLSPLQRPSTSE